MSAACGCDEPTTNAAEEAEETERPWWRDPGLVVDGEMQASVDFLRWALDALAMNPGGPVSIPADEPLPPFHLAASVVEAWRGPVLHLAVTGGDARFRLYKLVDPSFFDWTGLALALRGEGISDFPLCNKSFNLSYCGFDL